MLNKLRKPIRQGDVLLIPMHASPKDGKKLSHLTLAEGEVTGHSHRISSGEAELYERNGTLYLKILSNMAVLNHEEHHALEIPQGNWMIRIQREYSPVKATKSVSTITPETSLSQDRKAPNSQSSTFQTTQHSDHQIITSDSDDLERIDPSLMREVLKEANYWESHVARLEKQKEAWERTNRRIRKQKEEEEEQTRSRRFSRQKYEERRQIQSLLPLIQDSPKPVVKTQTQPQTQNSNITQRLSHILKRSQTETRNWRNVVD
jgi:hypothetical protein